MHILEWVNLLITTSYNFFLWRPAWQDDERPGTSKCCCTSSGKSSGIWRQWWCRRVSIIQPCIMSLKFNKINKCKQNLKSVVNTENKSKYWRSDTQRNVIMYGDNFMFYDPQFSGKLYMLYIFYHFSSDDIQEDRFVRCPKGTQRKEDCIVDTALGHRFVKRVLRGDVITWGWFN